MLSTTGVRRGGGRHGQQAEQERADDQQDDGSNTDMRHSELLLAELRARGCRDRTGCICDR
jgi:hypothetical protein